jgi:endonuclease/exonuclease/phosphatase family metal-dependent hydrolase
LIILGDFNATPYTPRFRSLLGATRLKVAGPRWFWPATYPVGGPLIYLSRRLSNALPGLLIDHVLVDRHFAVQTFRRGPEIGADHYPIVVDLELGAATKDQR